QSRVDDIAPEPPASPARAPQAQRPRTQSGSAYLVLLDHGIRDASSIVLPALGSTTTSAVHPAGLAQQPNDTPAPSAIWEPREPCAWCKLIPRVPSRRSGIHVNGIDTRPPCVNFISHNALS